MPNSIILQGISEDELLEKMENRVNKCVIKVLENHFNKVEEILLTRQETSAYLKINLSTLWHWQKKGLIPSYSVGNRVYFKLSEINEALTKIN